MEYESPEIGHIVVKLEALRDIVRRWLEDTEMPSFAAERTLDLFGRYENLRDTLRMGYPSLFQDLPVRQDPTSRWRIVYGARTLLKGPKQVQRKHLVQLTEDIDYCLSLLERVRTGEISVDQPNVFRKEGDHWTVVYAGEVTRPKDDDGITYIAHLLRHQGSAVDVVDLWLVVKRHRPDKTGLGGGDTAVARMVQEGLREVGLDTGIELSDPKTIGLCRRRIANLREELNEAKELGADEVIAHIEDEIQSIDKYIGAVLGISGRVRKGADNCERVRKAVAKSIRSTIEKIRDKHETLGHHLSTSITMGSCCSYSPDRPVSWLIDS